MKDRKFKIIVLALLFALPVSMFSQRFRQWARRNDCFLGHMGVSYGNETFIGAPKMGALCQFPILKSSPLRSFFQFHPISFYAGAEISVFVFFMGAFSASVNGGFAMGPITLDGSLTRLAIAGPSSSEQKENQTSYNPKIGIHIGPVWVKAGPSFVVSKNEVDMGEEFNIRMWGHKMNFELSYITTIDF